MLAKIPIAGTPIEFMDIFRAITRSINKGATHDFITIMEQFLGTRFIHFTDSGLASFYIILEALKKISGKKEVILPSYTAGNLIVAIQKAGLVPVLCDISMEDFNPDRDSLLKAVTSETLAVVLVHMFGIPIKDIEGLRNKIPRDVFIIEDCAQSFGARVGGKSVGRFGDISFFSFNRGKNLPTCGGGCFATSSGNLFEALIHETERFTAKENSREISKTILKTLAISLAVRPLVYGMGYFFISRFKDLSLISDFEVKDYSSFQASLGLELYKKAASLYHSRNKNGMFLINSLKVNQNLIIPNISKDIFPVFNRFPLVFKNPEKVTLAQKKLWQVGIESSQMYCRPLYQMFNLGCKLESFPNTEYFYPRLLTLPVHPGVKEKDLANMTRVINNL
ncbi:MAG: DegT/DnrJ/EryC1/StrS family aminotransferase [Candidatus Omnitrophica bacterium]|nr:DegT/DnrJ/EryC1/StrS family aminotransferase [Candidatus Omnitrophota bacterium]